MELEKAQAIIEAMLFASGREVKIKEIMNALELGSDDIDSIMKNMKLKYDSENSGIELIKVDDGYQLCTKKEYYEYIYPLFDNRAKPTISNAALETLSIIAYNPRISRAEIEAIRGVNVDATIYKLLELKNRINMNSEISDYLCNKFVNDNFYGIKIQRVIWDISVIAYLINKDWFKTKNLKGLAYQMI